MDKTQVVIGTLGNMKGDLKQTMDKMIDRDDKLEDMMHKTNQMSDVSSSFTSKSRKVHRNAWLSSIAGKLIMAAVAIVLIYAILAFFCGGLSIPKCR